MIQRTASMLLLFVWLCALAACDNPFISPTRPRHTPPPMREMALKGTSWTLTHLVVNGHSQPLVPTTLITLQFEASGSAYVGSSGCNYYSGTYHVTGNQLQLIFGSVTLKGCSGPIMSQEASYLNTLQRVRSFALSGVVLTLRDEQGLEVLAYSRA
jgi:heat shock protein HslJ